MLEFEKLEDLEDLEDITDTLIFHDEPYIFTEEHAVELLETALHLMDNYMEQYPTAISEPNFQYILLEDIKEIFYIQMEEQIDDLDYGDDIEDDINEVLEVAFDIFITTFHTQRTSDDNTINIKENYQHEINVIEHKIQCLRDIPQPIQRTPEWYQFRWNLITASNAWKAFETQSSINQLIYEKCQPIKSFEEDGDELKMVNTNTPMHWGQKFEPLSVMIYENIYNSKVEDFGCIQHPTYKFVGASPDGIIIESSTGRYGRMLEIKNPVSREITGVPKKEYWVQMQLQMEVCDLDECDFLETKFAEYPDYDSYYKDSATVIDLIGHECKSYNKTANNSYKGTIIYFHTKERKPFYLYQPLKLQSSEDISKWEEDNIEKYESAPFNYTFFKFIYWKLDKLSCVLVLRNKDWFKNNIGQLEKVWKTIEAERITGYEHRGPVKKQKKEPLKPFVEQESQGCLLKFNKIIKVDI
jgi:putative phage-type endonuclease